MRVELTREGLLIYLAYHYTTRGARIGVIYYDQIMLVPVLKVKRNNPVTISKNKTTRGKGNQEKVNDHAFPVSLVLWNCLEDFWASYTLAMDIKAGHVPEGRENSFRPAEKSNSWYSRIPPPRWIRKETTSGKEEYNRHLLGAPTFLTLPSIVVTSHEPQHVEWLFQRVSPCHFFFAKHIFYFIELERVPLNFLKNCVIISQ